MVQSTLVKPKAKPVSLARWLYQQLALPDLKLKTQQRGNVLHVLLEGQDCPSRSVVLARLVEVLQAADWGDRFQNRTAPIYKLIVYGRERAQPEPHWCQSVHLNQLERYAGWLASPPLQQPPGQEQEPETAASSVFSPGEAAIARSNYSQAQQGEPEAIARHLSDRLSPLGVAVRVAVKAIDPQAISLSSSKRLWVLCESDYSINATTTAEWIAQELRHLQLEGFQDAAVFSQVKGEIKPDWSLRVDLTPPEELLRQWSRWGDVAAIERLLNRQLQPQSWRVEGQLQSKTLHLFCRSTAQPAEGLQAAAVRDRLAPLLIELAPQGIHAVSFYGLAAQAPNPVTLAQNGLPKAVTPEVIAPEVADAGEDPLAPAIATPLEASPAAPPPRPAETGLNGIEWVALPAAEHPALSPSPLELAEQGDLAAATFLLSRLLNPDLDAQLVTGGIRVQLLRKGDLLHVMCDAPRCPQRQQIGRPVAKYIRQLRLPKISGLRIYGRRAGQVQPRWQYGRDFVPREGRGDLAPQFQVAEASGDLLTQDAAAVGLARAPWRLAKGFLDGWSSQGQWGLALQPWLDRLHQGLVRSQLFVPRPESDWALERSGQPRPAIAAPQVAMIWAALGLMVVGGSDLILGQLLRPEGAATEPIALAQRPNALGERLLTPKSRPQDRANRVPGSPTQGAPGSTADSFITGGGSLPARPSDLPEIAARMAEYPSFNNPLFDEKLALYRQRVAEEGPPDILVVGSSRALRGIDPTALTAGLAEIGKQDLKVFNFSINGATAQVVELQLLMLLQPDHRPGLILWADGARAFNSGREDATYQAVASSEGFRKLSQNRLPRLFESPSAAAIALSPELASLESRPISLSALLNLQGVNAALDRGLGRVSAVHSQRDRLRAALTSFYIRSLTGPNSPGLEASKDAAWISDAPEGEGYINFDGFMPLSLRFNPATYYQRYSRVTGKYDGDYQGFRMEGIQLQSLEGVIQLTSQYQIPLVFVNLPLTADYLDADRLRYESVFKKQMFQRMTQRQLIFRDLAELWPQTVDHFSDPSHLNQYGARAVSTHLAQDPMIPWPQVSP